MLDSSGTLAVFRGFSFTSLDKLRPVTEEMRSVHVTFQGQTECVHTPVDGTESRRSIFKDGSKFTSHRFQCQSSSSARPKRLMTEEAGSLCVPEAASTVQHIKAF